MTRLLITSDLHLGHKNIHKFRPQFSSAEEHHEVIFENLARSINKRDSLILLGDTAFNHYWLNKVSEIKCNKKLLVCGNHDLERGIKMVDLCNAYDEVQALYSKRNVWFSHCPIHPDEFRSKTHNIHGHTHGRVLEDSRYINVCVEQTNYEPVAFTDLF